MYCSTGINTSLKSTETVCCRCCCCASHHLEYDTARKEMSASALHPLFSQGRKGLTSQDRCSGRQHAGRGVYFCVFGTAGELRHIGSLHSSSRTTLRTTGRGADRHTDRSTAQSTCFDLQKGMSPSEPCHRTFNCQLTSHCCYLTVTERVEPWAGNRAQ